MAAQKNCKSCDALNQNSAKFCLNCGQAFSKNCLACNKENIQSASFCIHCGQKFEAKKAVHPNKPKAKAAKATKKLKPKNKVIHREQQNIVTVMSSDLKGFTALSEKLNPDQVKFIMDYLLKELSLIIEDHHGFIDKYIGDAILAVFGIPKAADDDPFRAISAGLKMQEKMKEISEVLKRDHGLDLMIRIGINTGKVILERSGKGQDLDINIIGDTVNLAQETEAKCSPGEVLISEYTFRLVSTEFTF